MWVFGHDSIPLTFSSRMDVYALMPAIGGDGLIDNDFSDTMIACLHDFPKLGPEFSF